MFSESIQPLTLRVINALYVEAMVLADEARAYFDQAGHSARDAMRPLDRVSFSCESLKVTTRLMHSIAWLLTQRAMEERTSPGSDPRLGLAASSDSRTLDTLPEEARRIVSATIDLYDRITRLQRNLQHSIPVASPARQLQSRLQVEAMGA
jgi:regulator of CtrA degradation